MNRFVVEAIFEAADMALAAPVKFRTIMSTAPAVVDAFEPTITKLLVTAANEDVANWATTISAEVRPVTPVQYIYPVDVAAIEVFVLRGVQDVTT